MTELFDHQISNLWPAVGLAVAFPAAIVTLNESIALCERRGIVMARTLRSLRNLVIPSLALLIFARFILELPRPATSVRVIETTFWIVLLYTVLGVVNDIVFGMARPDSWRDKMPTLFRDLLRAVVVAIGAMVVYSSVWGREIGGALTALGVGSVVIGLALQEPLGNIVSGLMLLLERPFNVGDWVNVNNITGKVIEINWRSVHIETSTRELRIVPNVSLYKSAFSNLSRPTHVRTESLEIGFSYDDPPNRVKTVMHQLLASTPGVLSDPPPAVRTFNYADFSITYRLIFSVASQSQLAATRDRLMTRLWYVARREGLTIPFPTAMEFAPGENPGTTPPSPAEWLRSHARFKPALKETTSRPPSIVDFARGESVQDAHSPFRGFALILQGHATLLSPDAAGKPVEIGHIGPGECFGDQLTAGPATEELGIVAAEDLKIMVFNEGSIDDLLNHSPGLASEIGDAIEARRQAALAARQKN